MTSKIRLYGLGNKLNFCVVAFVISISAKLFTCNSLIFFRVMCCSLCNGVFFLLLFTIRVKDLFPDSEIDRYAQFISDSLKRTKTREFVPSQEEIQALLTREEMTTTVYCHGGGSCKITINSHTSAGEVMH